MVRKIFTSDNGQFHNEHLLAGKWFPHEESIRIPLIIQDPRMPDEVRGTSNDEFTLNIDLAPTILSAAGISVPDRMQGSDMAELYLNPDGEVAQSWRKDFFYEVTLYLVASVWAAKYRIVGSSAHIIFSLHTRCPIGCRPHKRWFRKI